MDLTGPYSLAGNTQGNPSKGPTCEALKRALSRAGAPSLPWQEFDQHYNLKLEEAWDWYDRKVGAGTGNNGYSKGRWKRLRSMKAQPGGLHAGEWALDAYGMKLIQDEAGETSDSDALSELQQHITVFIKAAIANERNWHYDMSRPVKLNIDPSAGFIRSDCSGFVIQAADYARRRADLFGVVQDPSKMNWSGYGNCCDPAVRTLTRDLRWVALGDLDVGDELWGFDADLPIYGKGRKYRAAVVEESFLTKKDCVRVCFGDGSNIICSIDHPWLVKSEQAGNWTWREAKELFPYQLESPRLACRPFNPWTHEQTYESGWLAGMFDGEGHVASRSCRGGAPHVLGITQAVGHTADRLVRETQRYGNFSVVERPPPEYLPNAKTRLELCSNGMGLPGMLEFLGTIRPERLIENLDLAGATLQDRRRTEIVAVEPVGIHEVQSITTSSRTFFAEGFAVHNTDLYEDDWPKISAPFRIGDLAHFANSRHVVICFQAGDRKTAVWGSHGREAGPEAVKLSTYRLDDFMFVVRPQYIPDIR